MDIESKLSKMDFSGKSQIKESLRERLLGELRVSRELTLDELDDVVAAAAIRPPKLNPLDKKII